MATTPRKRRTSSPKTPPRRSRPGYDPRATHDLASATSASLTLKYVEAGAGNSAANNVIPGTYARIAASQPAMNIQITSASLTDDGTGVGTWELSWEEQGPTV